MLEKTHIKNTFINTNPAVIHNFIMERFFDVDFYTHKQQIKTFRN